MATKTKKDDEILYSKEQIIASKKYSNRKDILNVLLKDDEEYSFSRIDEIIENFMKWKVKKFHILRKQSY